MPSSGMDNSMSTAIKSRHARVASTISHPRSNDKPGGGPSFTGTIQRIEESPPCRTIRSLIPDVSASSMVEGPAAAPSGITIGTGILRNFFDTQWLSVHSGGLAARFIDRGRLGHPFEGLFQRLGNSLQERSRMLMCDIDRK